MHHLVPNTQETHRQFICIEQIDWISKLFTHLIATCVLSTQFANCILIGLEQVCLYCYHCVLLKKKNGIKDETLSTKMYTTKQGENESMNRIKSFRWGSKCLQSKMDFSMVSKTFVQILLVVCILFFYLSRMIRNHWVPLITVSIYFIYSRQCLQIGEMFLSSPIKFQYVNLSGRRSRTNEKKNAAIELTHKVFKLKNFFSVKTSK